MAQFNFLNENGNVSGKVRDQIRAKAIENAVARLGETAFVTNKGIVVPVGTDAGTGQEIYLVLAPAISMTAERPEKEAEASETEEIVVPDLF